MYGFPAPLKTSKGTPDSLHGHPSTYWKAIGILYVRAIDGDIELAAVYEEHVVQVVKDELAKRFGVAAIEWPGKHL